MGGVIARPRHCLAVPREQLARHWRTVAPWIVQACRVGGHRPNPDEVKERLFTSDEWLLILIRSEEHASVGCLVVEVMPERLHVTSCGGMRHMGDWLPAAVAHCVEICKFMRLAEITCAGRVGWGRRLPPHGFRFDESREVWTKGV